MSATLTFDTHAFVKRFKAVGFTDQQAEEVVSALREVRDARLDEMATRGDIKDLDARVASDLKALEVKLAESKAEIIKWMFGVAAGQAAFIIAILRLFPSP